MYLVYTKTVDSVFRALDLSGYSTSGYPVLSRLSKLPLLATSTSVNNCYLFIYLLFIRTPSSITDSFLCPMVMPLHFL